MEPIVDMLVEEFAQVMEKEAAKKQRRAEKHARVSAMLRKLATEQPAMGD
jgi:septin family protein